MPRRLSDPAPPARSRGSRRGPLAQATAYATAYATAPARTGSVDAGPALRDHGRVSPRGQEFGAKPRPGRVRTAPWAACLLAALTAGCASSTAPSTASSTAPSTAASSEPGRAGATAGLGIATTTAPTGTLPAPPDLPAARRIAVGSPLVAGLAAQAPYTVVATLPASAGTEPDLALVSVVLEFVRPVSIPAGAPTLRPVGEGGPARPLDEAVVSSSTDGVPTRSVSVLVDPEKGTVFALLAGGGLSG